MTKIYLSSTYSDLKEHREAVYRALRKMHHDVIAMEDYVATDQRPLDKCLEDVRSCDLYIGLFAWRYGYIPLENNPEQQSITELEYRTAVKQGKPTLLFLLDENAPWSPKLMDSHTGEGNAGASILALRQEFFRDKLISTFEAKEDIATVVISAVHDWEKRHNPNTTVDPFLPMRTKYLEKLIKRYDSVTLPLGPTEGFSLHAIFQPLSLRNDPLLVDSREEKKRHAHPDELAEHTPDEARERKEKGEKKIIAAHAEDALSKSPQGRIIILGGPGTGKTTTLQYLIACRAKEAISDPKASLPIIIPLPAFARSGKTLQQYLVNVVEDMGIEGNYADQIWETIEAGHAFVALDSLDEVEPGERPRMIELINRLASEPSNIWLVGSRFTEYKGGQFKYGQFAEWELLPMDKTLRRDLGEKLFPELRRLLPHPLENAPTPQEFVDLLEKHPHAAAWGENPLLFSLAAVIFVQTGKLPSSRATLYRDVIDAVLSMRESSKMKRDHLLRPLTGLALWLHQTKGRTFTHEDLFAFLEDIQQRPYAEAENIAKSIITSGILDTVAPTTYSFRHQTFQEYLAAVELARRLISQNPTTREEAWKLAWSKRTYSRWTEVLRLMTGALMQIPGKKGQLEAIRWLQTLLEQRETEEGDPGHLGLELTIKSLVEVTELIEWETSKAVQLEKRAVTLWLDELFNATRKGRSTVLYRLRGLVNDVVHLQQCDKASISKRLVNALKDIDFDIQSLANGLLGRLEKWIPINLLDAMFEDNNTDVRRSCYPNFSLSRGARSSRTPSCFASGSSVVCTTSRRASPDCSRGSRSSRSSPRLASRADTRNRTRGFSLSRGPRSSRSSPRLASRLVLVYTTNCRASLSRSRARSSRASPRLASRSGCSRTTDRRASLSLSRARSSRASPRLASRSGCSRTTDRRASLSLSRARSSRASPRLAS